MIRITDVTSLWERIQRKLLQSKENGLVIAEGRWNNKGA